MTPVSILVTAVLLVVVLPIVAYLTSKAVSFGWRRGGQLFDEWTERRKRRRGDRNETINHLFFF